MAEKTESPVTPEDLKKDGYKAQWGVILICDGESDQIALYNALKVRYPERKIKVVTT